MLSWLFTLAHTELQCGEGRKRRLKQLWLASFWVQNAVPRAVSYLLSFLTLEVNVREVPGSTLIPKTVNCTRTNLFHHCMVGILSTAWARQRFCTIQLRPTGPKRLISWRPTTKKLNIVWPEAPACNWAGTLHPAPLMQLLAGLELCPRWVLHSAGT